MPLGITSYTGFRTGLRSQSALLIAGDGRGGRPARLQRDEGSKATGPPGCRQNGADDSDDSAQVPVGRSCPSGVLSVPLCRVRRPALSEARGGRTTEEHHGKRLICP